MYNLGNSSIKVKFSNVIITPHTHTHTHTHTQPLTVAFLPLLLLA